MDIDTRTAETVLRIHGKDAQFLPASQPPDSGPITVRIIIDKDVERTVGGMQSATMERRIEITGGSTCLEGPNLKDAKSRDKITDHTGQTWLLSEKTADDGYLVIWSVTPARA